MIRYACPQCGEMLTVDDHKAGETYICPLCESPTTVPADAAGERAEARACLRRFAAVQHQRPLTATELRQVAGCYRVLGNDAKAERAVAEAARLDPDHGAAAVPDAERAADDAFVVTAPDDATLGSALLLLGSLLVWAVAVAFVVAPWRWLLLANLVSAFLIGAGVALRGGPHAAAFAVTLLLTPVVGVPYALYAATTSAIGAERRGLAAAGLALGALLFLVALPLVVLEARRPAPVAAVAPPPELPPAPPPAGPVVPEVASEPVAPAPLPPAGPTPAPAVAPAAPAAGSEPAWRVVDQRRGRAPTNSSVLNFTGPWRIEWAVRSDPSVAWPSCRITVHDATGRIVDTPLDTHAVAVGTEDYQLTGSYFLHIESNVPFEVTVSTQP